MMRRDPRAPVIVGAGQLTSTDRTRPTSPLELMSAAAGLALQDTGLDTAVLAESLGAVGVTDCLSWQPPDPARALAEALGASPHTTVGTYTGGVSPILLLAHACEGIAQGEFDTALIAGGEAIRALADGRYDREPRREGDPPPTVKLGTDREATHPHEAEAGLSKPAQFYPLFEHALRRDAGRGRAEHEQLIAELWSRFSAVAAEHPHAVVRAARTPEQLLDTGAGNRLIDDPYRRAMTANIYTDQAAALVLCSAAAAEAAGIPPENWVHVHATAAATETWFVGARPTLHTSPALASIADLLAQQLGRPAGDCEHIDLYSCFPSAVQIAAHEFGIDLAAGTPTLTGGLSFFGGPASNYSMHAMATAVPLLRAEPGSTALCTGVGWFMTEHAATVLGTAPPVRHYEHLDGAHGPVAGYDTAGLTGEAVLETYTIDHDRDGEPVTAYLSCLFTPGRRAFARVTDPAALAWLSTTDPLGTPVVRDAEGGVSLPALGARDGAPGK